MSNDDSFIGVRDGAATSFVGPDAVRLYQAVQLKSFIGLHQKTGMIPTRGVTITRMLDLATSITGKPYKGKDKHDKAMADLQTWIDTMKAAIPVIEQK